MTHNHVILYGLPHSLYTAKVRAYLRKQGIVYTEVSPSDPAFAREIVPEIGRSIIPVVELTDGKVIQDTVDIIDYYENTGSVRWTAYPSDAAVRAISYLFELYSVVGLTRHAMHYRWSYLEEQENFLKRAFAVGGDEQRAQATMGRMQSYLPMLGVSDDTIPVIEQSFYRMLEALDLHFQRYPYLLGNQPSVGDYALFGPLYGHLGRDPVPLRIMQNRAPGVFRWTERMHAPDLDLVEYPDRRPGFAKLNDLMTTLGPLLDQIAEEMVPDLLDRLKFLEDFVAEGHAKPGVPVTEKPHQRIIGEVDTSFCGVSYRGGVQPYTFFLWQRLNDTASAAPELKGVLQQHGLASLTDMEFPMRVGRRDHIEVWVAPNR